MTVLMPRMAASTSFAAFVRLPETSATPRPFSLLIRGSRGQTRPRTECPRSTSALARLAPIRPVIPVMRMDMETGCAEQLAA